MVSGTARTAFVSSAHETCFGASLTAPGLPWRLPVVRLACVVRGDAGHRATGSPCSTDHRPARSPHTRLQQPESGAKIVSHAQYRRRDWRGETRHRRSSHSSQGGRTRTARHHHFSEGPEYSALVQTWRRLLRDAPLCKGVAFGRGPANSCDAGSRLGFRTDTEHLRHQLGIPSKLVIVLLRCCPKGRGSPSSGLPDGFMHRPDARENQALDATTFPEFGILIQALPRRLKRMGGASSRLPRSLGASSVRVLLDARGFGWLALAGEIETC